MNILLLGSTGATGKALLQQTRDAGHSVTVLVRNPDKLPTDRSDLRIVVGDATDEQILKSAMAGNELLISTLGSVNPSLIARSTSAIIAAAKNTSLKRVIMLSSFATRQDQLTRSAKLLTSMLMKKVISDKQAGEMLLRPSGLVWTIVYATTLTNAKKHRGVRIISPNEPIGLKNHIARIDVAAWIVGEIDSSIHINEDVVISQER